MLYEVITFTFHWRSKAKEEGQKIIDTAYAEGRRVLLEHEAKKLVHLHGAPAVRDRLATTPADAVKQAARMGGMA